MTGASPRSGAPPDSPSPPWGWPHGSATKRREPRPGPRAGRVLGLGASDARNTSARRTDDNVGVGDTGSGLTAPAGTASAPQDRGNVPATSVRVLVVDDDPIVRDVLIRYLR